VSRGARDRLMSILPRSSAYTKWVGVVHLRKMNAASTEDRRVNEAKQAIAWLERSRRIRRERMEKRREAWTRTSRRSGRTWSCAWQRAPKSCTTGTS
jgi:hypothetical protein